MVEIKPVQLFERIFDNWQNVYVIFKSHYFKEFKSVLSIISLSFTDFFMKYCLKHFSKPSS